MKSTRRSHRHQLVLGLEPGPQRPAFTPQDPLLLQTMADSCSRRSACRCAKPAWHRQRWRPWMSPKLTSEHLAKSAVIYIRQSSMGQVVGNLESQKRQYALGDAAKAAGFAAVTTIDDDLGRSGSGLTVRPGFQRLVADVCAGLVGAVYCLEASRLARNGRDWHHLIDLCALAGALVIDLDGVYDPRHSNGRAWRPALGSAGAARHRGRSRAGDVGRARRIPCRSRFRRSSRRSPCRSAPRRRCIARAGLRGRGRIGPGVRLTRGGRRRRGSCAYLAPFRPL